MAIDRFKEGHYYVWVGPSDYYTNWNNSMNKVKDGRPREWFPNVLNSPTQGALDETGIWNWASALEHFNESFDDIIGL